MRVRLTLPQLDAFLKLQAAGSFRDAALLLGVSQPALSRTIQQIETRLGLRLFDRDTRHVRLTPAGEQLQPIATKLIRDYEKAFEELEVYASGRTGRVRVATIPSVAASLLPRAIVRFRETYPSVAVEIWEDVGAPVHRAVEEGTADVGIAPPATSIYNLNFRKIFSDDVVLVCRADDPLAEREEHDWGIFSDRPFVAMSTDTGLRQIIDEALAAANVQVEALFNCKQPTTVGSLVAASLGISALTRLTVAQLASPALTSVPLANPARDRPIGIITHPARSLHTVTRQFLREVEAEAKALSSRS